MRLNNNSNKPMWIEIYEFDISYDDLIGMYIRYDFRTKIYSETRRVVGVTIGYIQDILNFI
jgi:hypothetical protein